MARAMIARHQLAQYFQSSCIFDWVEKQNIFPPCFDEKYGNSVVSTTLFVRPILFLSLHLHIRLTAAAAALAAPGPARDVAAAKRAIQVSTE